MRVTCPIIILYLLIPFATTCQVTFEKTILSLENQIGEDIIQTDDSCYVVIGGQEGWDNQWPLNHFLIYKFNQYGNIIWRKILGEWFDDSWGFSVLQIYDNEFIGCGMGRGLLIEPYLVKYKPEGDTSWTRVINLESGYNVALSVCQTYDHGFVLCGTLSRASMFVIRTDSTGDKLWLKYLDDPDYQNESAECIIEARDSSLIICGNRNDSLALIKLSPAGDSVWIKYYHEMPAAAYSLKQTEDNGFIITGWAKRENNTLDVLLIKADENGDFIWLKTYGGSENDYADDIEITDDQGFIICGTTNSIGVENSNVYLIKTDYKGDTLWTKTFGGNLDEAGLGIDCTFDGGYIITGYKDLNDTLTNVYLIKTNNNGMVGIQSDEPLEEHDYLSVFPNPTKDVLSVKGLGLNLGINCSLIVYDIYGRKVQEIEVPEGQDEIQINIEDDMPGIYFMALMEDENLITSARFIVTR
jgi:hypothetical protein